MSIYDFFDHTCNLYHQNSIDKDKPLYGLDSQVVEKYPDDADITAVACHFSVKDENVKTLQNEPQKSTVIFDTLALPAGTDVRKNDKVVDLVHDVTYTIAKPPRNIRNHHIKCNLYMLEKDQDT